MAKAKKEEAAPAAKGPFVPLRKPLTPRDIIILARQHGPACIAALAEVAEQGSDASRVAAAKALLDRGFGKAGLGLEQKSLDNNAPAHAEIDLSALSAGELAALARSIFGREG